MIIEEEAYLAHYGILRQSGRYPWGSGGNQSTRNKAFLDYVKDLREKGLTDTEIARGLGVFDDTPNSKGVSTTQFRAAITIAKNEQKQSNINFARRLKDKGTSTSEIGRRMGLNESSVRALLADGEKEKADILTTVTNMVRDEVDSKRFVDVGRGVENHIGVSKEKLAAAVAILREEGYKIQYIPVRQLGTGHETSLKVLTPPDVSYSEVSKNKDSIQQLGMVSKDHGRTFTGELGLLPPLAIPANRVAVNYKEDGGAEADGVIYVRRDVPDVSLGNASYAQVRIQVGDGHYLKGMAMYKEGLPDGVDLVFNTNKSRTDNKLDAMKPLQRTLDGEVDKDNPFGAVVKQLKVTDADGKEKVTSAMNLVNEEGQWEKWSNSLSPQFLSKQSPTLAKTQLDMTYERRQKEYEEIMALTNPTVRKKLLEEFSDGTEAASVHLKAANLPRQASHVILPISSMSPQEVYAPKYENGERVVLVRYPHGGTFEIPELIVNNRQPEARRLLKDAKDAIGIHSSVAERLSGADFDGDTVLVIPNNSGKVTSTAALAGLKDFDPRSEFKGYPGMKVITKGNMQTQMGVVSNLITDMTLRKASPSEMARAIRHSMVVIDSYKHELDWKESERVNGISQLKEKYQFEISGTKGATTLISRAKSEQRVPERKPRSAKDGGPVNRETGKREYEYTGRTYVNAKGKVVPRTTSSTKLAEADDAHSLSSGTKMERLYADHSNKLKALADQARLDALRTPRAVWSPSAKQTYANEVESLGRKLDLALRNAPLERQAQLVANTISRMKIDQYPDMDKTQKKRIEAQALMTARARTGAKKLQIEFTQSEWDAIQAGAISDTMLDKILDNADMDKVREFATPKVQVLMTPIMVQRAQAMFASGATRGEVAAQLGVSLSTLDAAAQA